MSEQDPQSWYKKGQHDGSQPTKPPFTKDRFDPPHHSDKPASEAYRAGYNHADDQRRKSGK